MRLAPLPPLLLLLLAGCDGFPEPDAAGSRAAGSGGYPALAPLDALVAQGEAAALVEEDVAATEARAARLRARAAGLRQAGG